MKTNRRTLNPRLKIMPTGLIGERAVPFLKLPVLIGLIYWRVVHLVPDPKKDQAQPCYKHQEEEPYFLSLTHILTIVHREPPSVRVRGASVPRLPLPFPFNLDSETKSEYHRPNNRYNPNSRKNTLIVPPVPVWLHTYWLYLLPVVVWQGWLLSFPNRCIRQYQYIQGWVDCFPDWYV